MGLSKTMFEASSEVKIACKSGYQMRHILRYLLHICDMYYIFLPSILHRYKRAQPGNQKK